MNIIKQLTQQSYKQDRPAYILCMGYDSFFERDLAQLDCKIQVVNNVAGQYCFSDYNPSNITNIKGAKLNSFGQEHFFDFVLCNDRGEQLNNAINASQGMHIPLVIADHCTYEEQLNPAIITRMRSTGKHAELIVSCNQHALLSWGNDEEWLSPYGIEIPEAKSKDIDFLISGHFTGQDISNVRSLAHSLGATVISPSPELKCAPSTYLEWLDKFQRAKVFINLSVATSLSRDILTAMACNCAIITNTTQTISSIFTHEHNCLAVPTLMDIEGLVERLSTSPDMIKSFCHINQEIIKKDFQPAVFNKKWSEVFANMKNKVFTHHA